MRQTMMTRWLIAAVFLLTIANFGFTADTVKPIPFGTLKSDTPADWKAEKPANRLRSHQFKIASGEEGVADAEVNGDCGPIAEFMATMLEQALQSIHVGQHDEGFAGGLYVWIAGDRGDLLA